MKRVELLLGFLFLCHSALAQKDLDPPLGIVLPRTVGPNLVEVQDPGSAPASHEWFLNVLPPKGEGTASAKKTFQLLFQRLTKEITEKEYSRAAIGALVGINRDAAFLEFSETYCHRLLWDRLLTEALQIREKRLDDNDPEVFRFRTRVEMAGILTGMRALPRYSLVIEVYAQSSEKFSRDYTDPAVSEEVLAFREAYLEECFAEIAQITRFTLEKLAKTFQGQIIREEVFGKFLVLRSLIESVPPLDEAGIFRVYTRDYQAISLLLQNRVQGESGYSLVAVQKEFEIELRNHLKKDQEQGVLIPLSAEVFRSTPHYPIYLKEDGLLKESTPSSPKEEDELPELDLPSDPDKTPSKSEKEPEKQNHFLEKIIRFDFDSI